MATSNKARVTLGKRPETFSALVSALLPEGGEGTIEVTYRYRTRTELGALIDKRQADAEAADARSAAAAEAAKKRGEVAPPQTAADLQKMMRDVMATHILEIATGWNLPEPFDLQHVTQLCDELPGMARAIVDRYRDAIVEGRLGN